MPHLTEEVKALGVPPNSISHVVRRLTRQHKMEAITPTPALLEFAVEKLVNPTTTVPKYASLEALQAAVVKFTKTHTEGTKPTEHLGLSNLKGLAVYTTYRETDYACGVTILFMGGYTHNEGGSYELIHDQEEDYWYPNSE